MTNCVDVSEFDFYDAILHQEDHMKDHIGFRINKGEYTGVFVKIPLNNVRYYPELKDYSFEWTVFGNNHLVPNEKFYTDEFRFLMRDILDHMTKQQFRSLLESTNVDKKLPIDLPEDQTEEQSNMLMMRLFEEMSKSNNVSLLHT